MNGLDLQVSIKYMIAGYAVVLVVIPAYLVYLVSRWNKLIKDYQDLESMKRKK